MNVLYAPILILCCFLLSQNIFAGGCTLAIDSTYHTNVLCNGQSNGTITVYASGVSGNAHYSTGSGTVMLATQTFSSSVISHSGSGPQNVWWSPSTCTGGATWNYTAASGCPAGGAQFSGNSNSWIGCFLRSPNINMNGINTVVIEMDITNAASGANDDLQFYCWVNGGYPTLPTTVNGTSTKYFYLNTAHSCTHVTVTLDLSSIPTNNRSDFLFYIQADCNQSISCSSFNALVDNIQIAQGAPTQTGNTFTGLAAGTYTITVTDDGGCTATTSVTITQPNTLTASASHTNATTVGGNDGTATVNPTGGTTAYSYSWNTSPTQTTQTAVNLTAGNYCVTVTDANTCTATACTTVTQPNCAGFAISNISHTNVICHGDSNGTITVTATGGNAPYQYALDSGAYQSSTNFSSLHAGSYLVHIRDTAGCLVTSFGLTGVGQPLPISINLPHTDVTTPGGNDGFVIAYFSGGTPGYTFVWSNNADTIALAGLSAGIYCITVTDTVFCTASACVTVSEPSCSGFQIDSVVVTNPSCFGANDGSIIIYKSGGVAAFDFTIDSGMTIQSSNTFSNLSAGTYHALAKDGANCTTAYSQNPVVLTEPAEVSATVIVNGNNLSTQSFSSYQWYQDGLLINGANSQNFTSTVTGDYFVVVTDNNSCSDNSDTVHVVVTGVFSLSLEHELGARVFPNPFEDQFTVHSLQFAVGEKNLARVFDITGCEIMSRQLETSNLKLETNNWTSGIYFLELTTGNNISRVKLVKE